MILSLYLRFSTRVGQNLFISGSNKTLGNNDVAKAVPLYYLNDELWLAKIELTPEDIALMYEAVKQ